MDETMKKNTIIYKIFTVIFIFAISLIMFIWALWGLFLSKPNSLYAHLHLAFTLIFMVIVGAFVFSFLIKKMLRPLSLLNDAVKKAGQGDLNQQVDIKSNDELGSLANAFNKMTSELKKLITSREQLLSDVSHELRTPITRAWLALEMMPESEQKESIAGDLREMENLITGILESERLRNASIQASMKPTEVADLLQKLGKNYQHQSSRFNISPVTDDIQILVDTTLIMTVLGNLMENALKYSSSDDKPIEINVIKSEDKILIKIEDHGTGIPPEKLSYVFEPFYRADVSRSKKTGGYGLGLHLCKRIMDMHGAEIQLENKFPEGLSVCLIFQSSNPC
jgi:signal transduction histidine kinase